MRWPWQKPEQKQYESVLRRLVAAQEGRLASSVAPDNCMESPTVHAIVTAVSRRLASTPVHVFRKSESNGRETKEKLPNHPVTRLLQRPNPWQTSNEFWLDATSTYLRWGNFYAYKSRGQTGPIRDLIPLNPSLVEPDQDEAYNVTYKVQHSGGRPREYLKSSMFHARGPGRNYFVGDSPVSDIQRAIALEIMAERFGATFFQNGAIPLLIFSFLQGSSGFQTDEQRDEFVKSFQEAFSGDKKHRGMILPPGMDEPKTVSIDHDKAQFLETRRYQRTVIAGAFGVPPHLVGDLERGTFNNVEQQDKDFTTNVVMPVAQSFEQAMERDLLTPGDRAGNVAIRFNLDSFLRADFKTRQEGLKIQREAGVISPNEWREREGMNPRDGGDEYWEQGPSGQTAGATDEQVPDDESGNQESE